MADWVVQTRGRYAGRIGTVQLDDDLGFKHVRFGPRDPIVMLRDASLRQATQTEIADRLGCRVQDLPPYLKDAPK
ncbi:hypothetical protein [Phyllobacterium myrsinacearum]|uniref:Uncharacterized protein n=1 Tax=Phyllobacterium myrsinacearum TaxID=28101 RepID=A0A839EWV6_9HYPH|nr:hypothetical protein [Phyllobacterium myrsinacearum]MBA8881786.1 hypothetical protein [Phyllobacterium myrsinacearum]